MLLPPEDRETMYLRIVLQQSTGLPVLCVEAYDEEPANTRDPLALLALSTRPATVTAHLLRRLARLAAADAVGSGWVRPGLPGNTNHRFRR
jgi:hypothetical protein